MTVFLFYFSMASKEIKKVFGTKESNIGFLTVWVDSPININDESGFCLTGWYERGAIRKIGPIDKIIIAHFPELGIFSKLSGCLNNGLHPYFLDYFIENLKNKEEKDFCDYYLIDPYEYAILKNALKEKNVDIAIDCLLMDLRYYMRRRHLAHRAIELFNGLDKKIIFTD